MTGSFWNRYPDAPYATLLGVIFNYLNPDANEDMPALKRSLSHTDREWVRVFKEELRAVMRDPGVLPEGTLFEAASFEDGSERKFLDRLWRELYGDEQV
ncbi:MAG TPA: hypothetical protein VGL93_16150 [Streptosporangiaceae bacterium]